LTGLRNQPLSLLYRGSRDGFQAGAFHRLCDGKANTLTVIKNTNGCIFGGFASTAWSSSNGFKRDYRAFLFSLTNPSFTPLKLKVTEPKHAVYHRSDFGPIFGENALVVSDFSSLIKTFTNLL